MLIMTRTVIALFILLTYIIWASFLISSAYANEPIRVALIDTGLDLQDPRFTPVLCPTGHENLSGDPTIDDNEGHGTHIAGIIKQYAEDANYCLIILKYFSANRNNTIVDALRKAVGRGANIINISSAGPGFSESEYRVIKYASSVTIIAAAGNDGKIEPMFPGSYDLPNVINVGALDIFGKRRGSSNYGPKVKAWEKGEAIQSTLPGGYVGYMSGTSQATAVHTGKLIKEYSRAHP